MTWKETGNFLRSLPVHIEASLVGSTYILGEGNDVDIMWLVSDYQEATRLLIKDGYEYDKDYEDDRFASLRKGEVNVIVTAEEERYRNTLIAAEVCKYLKVAERDDRIAVHRIIRDGKTAENCMSPAQDIAFDDFD